MSYTAAEIAKIIDGLIEGDPDARVSRPARIEEALDGDFAFLDNPRYESHAYSTKASILLVHHSFSPPHPVKPNLIRVDNVRGSLVKLLPLF
ncbi:MAG: LpxD N-terminal domain-containing protein, partial [Bacteroidota bacterium]